MQSVQQWGLLAATLMIPLLSFGAGAPDAGAPPSPAAAWDAVAACAAKEGERARHACVDDVLRSAGLLTREREVQQQRSRFGLQGEAPPATASPPPTTPVPVTPAPAVEKPAAAVASLPVQDEVEVELAAVSTAADGKLVVTTTEGAVWRQTDSGSIGVVPRKGDRIRIRKASLGSYLCVLRTHVGYRCARSR